MATKMTDIKDAMLTEVAAELGASWKQLAYVEDIAKNSFRTSSERYGVRALAASEVPGVTKFMTFSQSFEVVLTKGYVESSIDDSEQVTKSYEIRALILDIFKRMVNNKAGDASSVMQVSDLAIDEPEYLVDDKVVIQRATMNITYRLTLL